MPVPLTVSPASDVRFAVAVAVSAKLRQKRYFIYFLPNMAETVTAKRTSRAACDGHIRGDTVNVTL